MAPEQFHVLTGRAEGFELLGCKPDRDNLHQIGPTTKATATRRFNVVTRLSLGYPLLDLLLNSPQKNRMTKKKRLVGVGTKLLQIVRYLNHPPT